MQSLLVVDDERMIRTLIRKYAEFDGYAVTEAEKRYGRGHALPQE